MAQSEPERLAGRLPAILDEATRQGSSDDITLALLLRTETVNGGMAQMWKGIPGGAEAPEDSPGGSVSCSMIEGCL
ncbi:MAG: hypothetical protein ABSF22_16300 [Bryobacteraceae bacterium]